MNSRPTILPAPATTLDLPAFAAAVLATLSAITGTGRFGHKVFVAAIAAELGLDLDHAKRRLVAAHRAGLLQLARLDLVAAADRATVAASEISHDGVTWHAVVDVTARPAWRAA